MPGSRIVKAGDRKAGERENKWVGVWEGENRRRACKNCFKYIIPPTDTPTSGMTLSRVIMSNVRLSKGQNVQCTVTVRFARVRSFSCAG